MCPLSTACTSNCKTGTYCKHECLQSALCNPDSPGPWQIYNALHAGIVDCFVRVAKCQGLVSFWRGNLANVRLPLL